MISYFFYEYIIGMYDNISVGIEIRDEREVYLLHFRVYLVELSRNNKQHYICGRNYFEYFRTRSK